MREIRQLDESHIDAYTEIAYNAYPSFKDYSEEAVLAYKETVADIMSNDTNVDFFGLFDPYKLIAVARFFKFRMNCFGEMVETGGLGFLGVHLMHKKQNAARLLIEYFENYCRERNLPVALLLPFRPDYYRRQGYGFGTKMNQYRIATNQIPAFKGQSDLRFVQKTDLPLVLGCYEKFVAKTHGMIMKIGDEIRALYNDAENRIIASYDAGGNMNGYMIFKFYNGKEGNYTINHIQVTEFIYETAETLRKLLGFLNKQQDQVQLVIFNTGLDAFHCLFDNPLNETNNYIPYGNIESNTQSVGVMYKVLSAEKAFQHFHYRNFNNGNLCVRFQIFEDQNPDKFEETIVQFKGGKACVLTESEKVDVTASIARSNFSSLFMGCVTVKELFVLGLFTLDSEQCLDALHGIFYCSTKPVNNTDF